MTVYVCRACGLTTAAPIAACPDCGEVPTIVERPAPDAWRRELGPWLQRKAAER